MLREVTIGQYYPVDSVLHRLDPRVKLLATLLYLLSLFLMQSWSGYAFAALVLCLLIRLSRVPVRFLTRGLRGILFILLLSVSFNLFLTPGTVLVQLGILRISREGLRIAIMMALRLILLVIGSSIMTLTTTPNQLTDGLEKGLGFLRLLHVPVHEIAMMMSIALRFIPILIEETDKIMKAQQARGADFESGGLLRRARVLVPILVPLFISAFRRASELAMAMEARCYHGGEGRTKLKPLRYERRDRNAYLLLALYLLCCIGIRFLPLP